MDNIELEKTEINHLLAAFAKHDLDRSCLLQAAIKRYINAHTKTPSIVESFLTCFKNYQAPDNDFHFNPEKATKSHDMSWIDAYAYSLGEKLYVIGEASKGYIILCMTSDGKVIGGYDEQIMLFGNSPMEALECLITKKLRLPTIEFKDQPDESIKFFTQRALESNEKGWVLDGEVAEGVIQHFSCLSKFSNGDLTASFAMLPQRIQERFIKTLTAIAKDNFKYPIVVVGGPGRMGNPDNLRQACELFGI